MEQVKEKQKLLDFQFSTTDSGHIIVNRYGAFEKSEIIGHVYVQREGDEVVYYSTNKKGREIFAPTTDFNVVEQKFTRYARLLSLQRVNNDYRKFINLYNSNTLNQNVMNTQQKNQNSQMPKKENQLRFLEYEKPTKEGHMMTIVDSYRNVLGRVHKTYNEQTKKYEYAAFDHSGKPFARGEKIWDVKNAFVKDKAILLENAHQRRIASKEKSNELSNLRESKAGREKSNDKEVPAKTEPTSRDNTELQDEQNSFSEREQELDDIRNDRDDDRGDRDIDY